MAASPSYEDMQWVLKHYKKINFKPQKGKVYFSDYCMIHETHRANDCDTRISIDTGLYIGEHKPTLIEWQSTVSQEFQILEYQPS